MANEENTRKNKWAAVLDFLSNLESVLLRLTCVILLGIALFRIVAGATAR